jgi:hypothetical protein
MSITINLETETTSITNVTQPPLIGFPDEES